MDMREPFREILKEDKAADICGETMVVEITTNGAPVIIMGGLIKQIRVEIIRARHQGKDHQRSFPWHLIVPRTDSQGRVLKIKQLFRFSQTLKSKPIHRSKPTSKAKQRGKIRIK